VALAQAGGYDESSALTVVVDRPPFFCPALQLERGTRCFRASRRAERGGRPHGTLKNGEERLPTRSMGFDVLLYLPPIHPIGQSDIEGSANNAESASIAEVGSPWGGNRQWRRAAKSIHPESGGTMEGFHSLVERKDETAGIETQRSISPFQCFPDLLTFREHPEWFRMRRRARSNTRAPAKKYQTLIRSIRNGSWEIAVARVATIFEFWIDRGVRVEIFRRR